MRQRRKVRFNVRPKEEEKETRSKKRAVLHPFGDAKAARVVAEANGALKPAASAGENEAVMEELLELQAVAVTGQPDEAAFRQMCVVAGLHQFAAACADGCPAQWHLCQLAAAHFPLTRRYNGKLWNEPPTTDGSLHGWLRGFQLNEDVVTNSASGAVEYVLHVAMPCPIRGVAKIADAPPVPCRGSLFARFTRVTRCSICAGNRGFRRARCSDTPTWA
jgi:hypothetical protein